MKATAARNEDHLSNEIAVSARIEDRGITGAARSRALAAIDRLLGSAADIPAAYFENIAQKARLRGEIERKKLIEAEANEENGLIESEAYLDAKLAEDQASRLENLSKVVDHSINSLDDEPFAGNGDEVDPDWLNQFKSHAEKVSSDTMQDLWGRILAGEIRKPSTFSLSTLRFLSEVDRKVAEEFRQKSKVVIGREFLPKPPILSGDTLLRFGMLEDAGLVRDVTGFLGIDKKPDDGGNIYHREGNLLLVLEVSSQQRLNLIPLTRVGKELLEILPQPDPRSALEAVFHSMNSDAVLAAKILVILNQFPDGRLECGDLDVLKAKS